MRLPCPTQTFLRPNSNHPINIDWADSQAAIGKEPGTEYSIFVGDLAGDVTNADLMNAFRNPYTVLECLSA
jgi:hypothetical protein